MSYESAKKTTLKMLKKMSNDSDENIKCNIGTKNVRKYGSWDFCKEYKRYHQSGDYCYWCSVFIECWIHMEMVTEYNKGNLEEGRKRLNKLIMCLETDRYHKSLCAKLAKEGRK